MATSSAPGKVYLFGEHAVVYGEPAIPCAIDLRATVTATRSGEGLCLTASALSLDEFTVEYGTDQDVSGIDAPTELVATGIAYVGEAVAQAHEAAQSREGSTAELPAGNQPKSAPTETTGEQTGSTWATELPGFDITIESDIPLGAGLGSSAAVVVATIDAAARELGVTLSREALADRAYRVENTVQDGAASRADTFCSTMGGAVRVEGDACKTLAAPNLPLVVGYDGGSGDTGALVKTVSERRDTYPFVADTIGAIGDLVRRGEDALASDDRTELGRLMDINHGLLSALGVSASSLDAMVWAARDADALGAKLTGAGGGGCIVALGDQPTLEDALESAPDCETANQAALDADGLRREAP